MIRSYCPRYPRLKTHTLHLRAILCTVWIAALFYGCGEEPDTSFTHAADFTTWKDYLGDPGRSHFSTLSQFNRENVRDLEVAWEYRAPDSGQMQMNPLVVDTVIYGVTAALRAFALDARTGEELWVFGDTLNAWHSTSRGVSYWERGDDKRILYTVGSDLYALDARTGTPVEGFGSGGKIDLRSGLPASAADKFVISNTPGTVFKDLIIMPLRISEGPGGAPGDIIAFNAITGEVAWVFHTIPLAGEFGADTWEDPNIRESPVVGAANNWAGMALDARNEILYVPTGSAAPDFYGGDRRGAGLFANTLLALDANTGERLWHFQFTHHDIWDRDPARPAEPADRHAGRNPRPRSSPGYQTGLCIPVPPNHGGTPVRHRGSARPGFHPAGRSRLAHPAYPGKTSTLCPTGALPHRSGHQPLCPGPGLPAGAV